MTVAPLVNLWGFGFSKKDNISDRAIDSILAITGFKTIKLVNHKVIKTYPETMLDASAIAKGYGVDQASEFLETKGIENYMVEIGGEIYCKGKNSKRKKLAIGYRKTYRRRLRYQ